MFALNKSLSLLKSLKDNNQEKLKSIVEDGKSKTKKRRRNAKNKKAKSGSKEQLVPGVIAVHNIPYGFFETQMNSYFSQFGKISRLRLSRSRKTGASRGYAYIEFECDEVAKIVAKTMDNYLMFNQILKCEFIPYDKIPPKIFRHWNKRQIPTTVMHKAIHNRDRTFQKEIQLTKLKMKKVKDVEKQLKKIGIPFSCEIVNWPPKKPDIVENVKDDSASDASEDEMIVHSSDEDIEFKTPPNAVRVAVHRAKKAAEEILLAQSKQNQKSKCIQFSKFPCFNYKFMLLRAASVVKKRAIKK